MPRRTEQIRKNDTVMVMSGKDRGHVGRVVNVLPGERPRAGRGRTAVAKRHTRPTRQNQQGGILDKEMPIDLSATCSSCAARAASPRGSVTDRGRRQGADLPQVRERNCDANYEARDSSTAIGTSSSPADGRAGLANVMQVPRLSKIIVNMGVGDSIKDGECWRPPSKT